MLRIKPQKYFDFGCKYIIYNNKDKPKLAVKLINLIFDMPEITLLAILSNIELIDSFFGPNFLSVYNYLRSELDCSA